MYIIKVEKFYRNTCRDENIYSLWEKRSPDYQCSRFLANIETSHFQQATKFLTCKFFNSGLEKTD